ncbi:MAG: phage portal protein [Anaerolineae bacterium]
MLRNFAKLLQSGKRATPPLASVAVHQSLNEAPPLTPNAVYQQSPWVYVAVNRIAEAAALVPLRVLRVDGERTLEVPRHPLEVLLEAPNPFMSRFELIESTIGTLELYGNAYWFLSSSPDGTPAQIWALRPDRMSVVPDAMRYVRGYVYEIDGLRIPLEPEEVIHFKRWHPANDYYGLSALEAARLTIQTEKAMAEWNRNTFSLDNGVPAGIVLLKKELNDADFERIKREWRASYGGTQRRTAFLRSADVEWKSIGLSHNDLEFLKGRQAHRDEILNIFGVPVGLISENATEANAKVAERQFIERTLYPKLVRLAQKITQDLLAFYPGTHLAVFDDIRPTDTQARLEEIKVAYPLLSINEIRARYFNLPAVAWGDVAAGAATPLPNPLPASGEREQAGTHDTVGAQRAAPSSDTPAASPLADMPQPEDALKAAAAELARWERFALKRLGRAQGRPFAVRALPDEVAFEVAAGLLAAQTEDEARAVFKDARAQLVDSR